MQTENKTPPPPARVYADGILSGLGGGGSVQAPVGVQTPVGVGSGRGAPIRWRQSEYGAGPTPPLTVVLMIPDPPTPGQNLCRWNII